MAGEARCCGTLQDRAVGLEGVAAAGGRHQHRIQRAHAGEARHQVGGQLACLRQFSLVVGGGAAAALAWRDYHLDAVGAEHLHRRLVHSWIKQALDAAQHQPYPGAALALGRHHLGERVAEGLRHQRWQQLFHRLQLGP